MQDVESIQSRLFEITVGFTTTIHGVVVTRWAKDAFEVGTLFTDNLIGSEHTAEYILAQIEK